MDVDRELDDMSRVQLYAVIKGLRTELISYKTIAKSYQKYFNFFNQINEIIVSKKSEVLDVIKDIQSFNDLKQKKNLSENDLNETNTENNEQNTNKSQERVEAIENANNSQINVRNRRSDDENHIITERNITEDIESVTTVLPIKFESISDVQEFNQIDSSADPQNDDNSVPKTLGFEYFTNTLNINLNSEETPNQTIVTNISLSEDNTEEVSNEFQVMIDNIRSLRSNSISGKPEDSSVETLIESITQSKDKTQQKSELKQMSKCKECHKVFGSSLELKFHQLIDSLEKPHKSNECNKGLKQLHDLRFNQKTRDNTNMEAFICEECMKSFGTLSHLKSHQLIHSNERQFVCDWIRCGKRFLRKSNLIQHKRIVHLKEKRFKCDYKDCQMKFFSKQHMNLHKRSHLNP